MLPNEIRRTESTVWIGQLIEYSHENTSQTIDYTIIAIKRATKILRGKENRYRLRLKLLINTLQKNIVVSQSH